MKTTKKLTIVKDFDSHYCYELFAEDITYLVNELNVFCEIDNNNFTNIVEDQKRYNSCKDDYQDADRHGFGLDKHDCGNDFS